MAGRNGKGHKPSRKPGKKTPDPATPTPQADEPLHLPRPLAARLLGVSDRTFDRLQAEGVFAPLTAGAGRRHSTYDGPTVVAAYLARQERMLTGSNESPRDRKDRSQAELNELRLARERRALLPRENVIRDGQGYIKATTANLRTIPSRAVRAGLVPAAQEADLATLIEDALRELARWKEVLDEMPRRPDEDGAA